MSVTAASSLATVQRKRVTSGSLTETATLESSISLLALNSQSGVSVGLV